MSIRWLDSGVARPNSQQLRIKKDNKGLPVQLIVSLSSSKHSERCTVCQRSSQEDALHVTYLSNNSTFFNRMLSYFQTTFRPGWRQSTRAAAAKEGHKNARELGVTPGRCES
ncbi:uncharacterized protein LOC110188426 [Drosophila serrata]|uniref:uncharacterized protein LOC110188426 n=1 Tax=Drosophila serrata TaxID=7274 RepID=UPI000A1D1356|nr:uncharacterized protein LOC110188426 [Drosophila serrata]